MRSGRVSKVGRSGGRGSTLFSSRPAGTACLPRLHSNIGGEMRGRTWGAGGPDWPDRYQTGLPHTAQSPVVTTGCPSLLHASPDIT